MNKVFKKVFNAARGMMMVVNETTSSVQTGKKAAVTLAAVVSTLVAGSAVAGVNEYVGMGSSSASGGAVRGNASSDLIYEGTLFKQNTAFLGGAIYAEGKLTIEDSSFIENSATWSGAIDAYGDTLIVGSTFTGNSAVKHAGAVYNNSGAMLSIADGTAFNGNKAEFGGAISNDSTANIIATTNNAISFEGNEATDSGGAIFNSGKGQLALENVKFSDNTVGDAGGAIYSNGDITAQGGEFVGNSAVGAGGAIFSAGTLAVTQTAFIKNTTEDYGGAVATLNGLVAEGVKFKSNSAYSGGAIGDFANSIGTIEVKADSVFYQNAAIDEGGAILVHNKLSVTDTKFVENSVVGDGGAIAIGANGLVTIKTSNFIGNQAKERGGAVMTRHGDESSNNTKAKLIISGSSFEKNSAAKEGGALHNSLKDTIVQLSVFNANAAGQDGGAIYSHKYAGKDTGTRASMTVEDSVFTNNTAGSKGGAIYNTATLTFKGTNTFSGNTAGGKANDIYNTGTIKFADGAVLSLAGGINGEGGVIEGVGSLVITDAAATIQGQTVADTITASATGYVNDQLGGNVAALKANLGGIAVTGMQEGAVMGAVSMAADGSIVTKINQKTEALADKVTLAPQVMTRIMMNDLRKRMGDIRAGEGTNGVWARYNGGEMGGSGVSADFHMIQVGIDTVPTANAPRLGVAFSYAQTDADDAYGTTEMDSYSLAVYGTKMYDNGLFVDVIGRIATMDTDMVNAGMQAKMDNMALSLSGELGWRFDVMKSVFVEPSAEITYTYTDADTFTMGRGTYELEATDSVVGRIGVAAGLTCPNNKGEVYVRAAAVHEFMGDTTMNSRIGKVSAAPIVTDGKDTWFE